MAVCYKKDKRASAHAVVPVDIIKYNKLILDLHMQLLN